MEIFIPEKGRSEDMQLRERVFEELGVDGFERRKNPLTHVTEIIAPVGMGFELDGEFLLSSDQNDIVVWGCPIPSTAMRDKEGSGWEDYGDDTADIGEVPDTYVGTRLSIAIRHPNRRTYNQGDGWARYYPKQWYHDDSDSDRPLVELHVSGPMTAWYESGLIDFSWQKGNNVLDWQIEMVDIPNGLFYWQIPVAEGDHLKTSLHVVPHVPAQPEFAVVERTEYDDTLWVQSIGLSDDVFSEHSSWLGNYNVHHGRDLFEPVPEDEHHEFMRYMRAIGHVMARDPLKNFKLFRNGPYESQVDFDDLGTLVEQTKRAGQKPPTYREAEEAHDRYQRKVSWREHEKKLRSTIAVAAGNMSLHQLARENSGDWLAVERKHHYNHPYYQ